MNPQTTQAVQEWESILDGFESASIAALHSALALAHKVLQKRYPPPRLQTRPTASLGTAHACAQAILYQIRSLEDTLDIHSIFKACRANDSPRTLPAPGDQALPL